MSEKNNSRLPNSHHVSNELSTVAGWGRVMPSRAQMETLTTTQDAQSLVRHGSSRGLIVRGLGRSYGDAAQNSGGHVALLADVNPSDFATIDIDVATGRAQVGGAVTIEQLLRASVPMGWFVPVTPGTRFVTIGGAIAADVHGKNHHVDGSFGSHVHEITMVLSDASVVTVSPHNKPDWFWATVGGMGLTGMIVQATVQMIPITTSFMDVSTHRVGNLEQLLSDMTSPTDNNFRYSVAWIDLTASRKALGRAVITRANHSHHARNVDAENVLENDPKKMVDLSYAPKTRLSVPNVVPNGLLNQWTIRGFNEMWYRKAPRIHSVSRQSITSFFHPLDALQHWNRLYGPRGFMQYQCIIPFGQEEALTSLINVIRDHKFPSFLAVLKRMGPSNLSPLSFGMPGWTLALDFPVHQDILRDALPVMDELVVTVGGRHYFAKDAHMTAQMVEAEYPRLNEWRAVCSEMDPHALWQSDLSRRISLRKVNS